MSMKLSTLFMLSVLLCALQGCSWDTTELPRRITSIPHAPITLDGNLEDWENVTFIKVTPENGIFDTESYGRGDWCDADSADDLSYRFAVCHDVHALYVAVEVTDDRLVTDDTTPDQRTAMAWRDDAVEIFIDGNHNRASNARDADGLEYHSGGEFAMVFTGATTSQCSGFPQTFGDAAYWQGATNYKAVRESRATKYVYEFRFSWRVMGGDRRPGDTIGMTLGVMDDDNGKERDHALFWKAISPYCWRDESGWGTVYIKPFSGN